MFPLHRSTIRRTHSSSLMVLQFHRTWNQCNLIYLKQCALPAVLLMSECRRRVTGQFRMDAIVCHIRFDNSVDRNGKRWSVWTCICMLMFILILYRMCVGVWKWIRRRMELGLWTSLLKILLWLWLYPFARLGIGRDGCSDEITAKCGKRIITKIYLIVNNIQYFRFSRAFV